MKSSQDKIDKLEFKLDVGSNGSVAYEKPRTRQQTRKLAIQQGFQKMAHAAKCRDINCPLSSCHKCKGVLSHAKVCKRKLEGDCPIGKQLIALCCYHANHCEIETGCPISFCATVKSKCREAVVARQKAQQDARLRRRR